jgi:hypothetical protein
VEKLEMVVHICNSSIRRLRQEDLEFQDSLGYRMKYCLKKNSGNLVNNACNLSYSGGRDQEDRRLKSALANSLQNPISKKAITKKGWWSGSRCRS